MDVGGLSGVLEIVRDHGHGLALHAGVAGNSPARVHRAPEAATCHKRRSQAAMDLRLWSALFD
jgi:hypothetical protein